MCGYAEGDLGLRGDVPNGGCRAHRGPARPQVQLTDPSSSLLLSSLELSDTKVYALQIRARLGTAAHLCKVVVLKLRTVPLSGAVD